MVLLKVPSGQTVLSRCYCAESWKAWRQQSDVKLNSDGKLGTVADQSVVKGYVVSKGASLSNECHWIKQINSEYKLVWRWRRKSWKVSKCWWSFCCKKVKVICSKNEADGKEDWDDSTGYQPESKLFSLKC